jgi:hypothetical protein
MVKYKNVRKVTLMSSDINYVIDYPLICSKCKKVFKGDFFGNRIDNIIDFCQTEKMKEELELLSKTEKMYNDYPDSKKRMISKWELGGVLPPTEEEIKQWTNGDSLLAEYLLTSSFDVIKRRKLIESDLKSKKRVRPVKCPVCKTGLICFKNDSLNDFLPKLT